MGATVIGVAPTPSTERDRGRSIIRFLVEDERNLRGWGLDSLLGWYYDDMEIILNVSGWESEVFPVYLREVNLDPSTHKLYVSIVTPHAMQEVAGWFD